MGWGSRRLCPARGIFRGAEDLKAYVLTQLDRSKVTRDIVFVDDPPRTALGKVQHFVLRQPHERVPASGEAI
jgi:fatty-acyl-CoA synthase